MHHCNVVRGTICVILLKNQIWIFANTTHTHTQIHTYTHDQSGRAARFGAIMPNAKVGRQFACQPGRILNEPARRWYNSNNNAPPNTTRARWRSRSRSRARRPNRPKYNLHFTNSQTTRTRGGCLNFAQIYAMRDVCVCVCPRTKARASGGLLCTSKCRWNWIMLGV